MFDYRAVAPLTYREPFEYSMAPRTVPVLVGRFTNPLPSAVNGTTPDEEESWPYPSRLQTRLA